MRRTLSTALLLILLLSVTAFGADYTPEELHGTPYPLTQRMRVELHVYQRHLDMQPEFTGGYGGNIALAYGVARAARQVADRRVAPLREALGQFPLDQVLQQALEQRLDRSLFAPELDVVVVDLTEGQKFLYRDQQPGRRILEITPFFGFNYDGSALQVVLQAQLQDRKTVDRRTRMFRLASVYSAYTFDDPSIAAVKKPEDRMPLWQQRLDRELLLQALQKGVDGAVAQLNTLLQVRKDCDAIGKQLMRCKPPREGEADGRQWRLVSGNEALVSNGPLPSR